MRTDHEVVRTHLEDLQSEMEAGSRTLKAIDNRARVIREELLARHLDQAAAAGALVRKISEMKKCIAQQRARLAELRDDVRRMREIALRTGSCE